MNANPETLLGELCAISATPTPIAPAARIAFLLRVENFAHQLPAGGFGAKFRNTAPPAPQVNYRQLYELLVSSGKHLAAAVCWRDHHDAIIREAR